MLPYALVLVRPVVAVPRCAEVAAGHQVAAVSSYQVVAAMRVPLAVWTWALTVVVLEV